MKFVVLISSRWKCFDQHRPRSNMARLHDKTGFSWKKHNITVRTFFMPKKKRAKQIYVKYDSCTFRFWFIDYWRREAPSEYSGRIRITRLRPIGSPFSCLNIVLFSMQCDVTLLLGEPNSCSVLNTDCEFVLKGITEMQNMFGIA